MRAEGAGGWLGVAADTLVSESSPTGRSEGSMEISGNALILHLQNGLDSEAETTGPWFDNLWDYCTSGPCRLSAGLIPGGGAHHYDAPQYKSI